MRKPKFTTRRWRFPGQMRRDRLREYLRKSALKDTFDSDFVKGLEQRKDLLESRELKFAALAAPIFLFLALSLMDVKVSLSVMGITVEAAKSIREVLLILLTVIGFAGSFLSREENFLKEMLKAVVESKANGEVVLKDFLELRYGLSQFSTARQLEEGLIPGKWQWMLFGVWTIGAILLLTMILGIGFAVQVLNLIAVYQQPNFSPSISCGVIAFVLLGDVIWLSGWLSFWAYQPFESFEDLRKLGKLGEANDPRYKEILADMMREHRAKPFFWRLLSRPKLKRIT